MLPDSERRFSAEILEIRFSTYATDRTEALSQKIPINLRCKPHQRMAKVDDRLQRRPQQIVLAIVARLTHGSPPTTNLAVKGITNRLNPDPKTQENRDLPPHSCKIE
jgi:hypothetical protein